MTLEEAELDLPLRITRVLLADETERTRLSGLGLREGALVAKLMPTPLKDPVSCRVGTQIMALERRLLRLIEVSRAP